MVIDEFSMESRSMFALILDRLRSAHIDINRVGILLIGDPGQLLPIASEPCWSIKMKKSNLKDFSEPSYIGLAGFRKLFRMPKLEQIPNFEAWKSNESIKKPSELQRKQVSEFTAAALCGDFDAVFLSEIKRRVDGDPLSHEFIAELVPSCRYGKITERNLLRIIKFLVIQMILRQMRNGKELG